jgi:hypothetical protein
MNYTWGWTCVLSIAAMGCAGKLDPNEDYYANSNPVLRPDSGVEQPAEQAGSGWREAPDGGWDDAGQQAEPPKQSAGQGGSGRASAAGSGSANAAAGRAGAPTPAAAGRGGSSAPAAGGGAPVAASCDFRALMQAKCGNSSCHGAPAESTGLDLTSAMAGARLDGRTGRTACTDKLLIDKDNPEDSVLYLKVSGSECGVRMPLGGTLSADEQDCVLSWIEGL